MHHQSLQLHFLNTGYNNCIFHVPTQIITVTVTLERPGRQQQVKLTHFRCSRVPVTLSWTSVPWLPWRLTVVGRRAGRKLSCTSKCCYILYSKKTTCTWTKIETSMKHQNQDWIMFFSAKTFLCLILYFL